jgi:two-component system sensor histidine kinase/response regulator
MNPTAAAPPRECILVVDDQPSNIQTVGTLLLTMGYDVMTATSADQALVRMAARLPDLLLLDMMMPGVNGLDLCRRMQGKEQWAAIPVIFLSAAGEANVIASALEAGAVDYVTKPFHRAELVSRVRTHLALKAARDQLRRTAAAKDELLALMTHDWQNYLIGMQLHADFLTNCSSDLSGEAVQCLEAITRETRRMSECLRELLADQAAGAQPLRRERIDLFPLLDEAAAAMRPLASAKGQSLVLEYPQGLTPCVTGNAAALRQVLDNLISNAIKFSPSGAVIRLGASAADGGTAISVSDNGPGFTESDKARAFQRYGRLTAQPTGGEVSTGLGLSIVKKLTELMGGTASLESTPGAGATLTVKLPPAATTP